MCKHVSPETGCPLLRSSAPVLGLSQKYNPAFPVVGNEINGDLLRRHGSISNTELLWRPFYPYLRTVHDRASPIAITNCCPAVSRSLSMIQGGFVGDPASARAIPNSKGPIQCNPVFRLQILIL